LGSIHVQRLINHENRYNHLKSGVVREQLRAEPGSTTTDVTDGKGPVQGMR
jgi:hypothetical protein